MNVQPANRETGLVRIATRVQQHVVEKIDAAAHRADWSSSGYMAAVLTNHVTALDLFKEGVSGEEISRILRVPYRLVMEEIGLQVDDLIGRRGRFGK